MLKKLNILLASGLLLGSGVLAASLTSCNSNTTSTSSSSKKIAVRTDDNTSKLKCLGSFAEEEEAYSAIDEYLASSVDLGNFYDKYINLGDSTFFNDIYIDWNSDYTYTYGIVEYFHDFEFKHINNRPYFLANKISCQQDIIIYKVEGDLLWPTINDIQAGDHVTIEHNNLSSFLNLSGYLSVTPFYQDWDANLAYYEVGVDGTFPVVIGNYYGLSLISDIDTEFDGNFEGSLDEWWFNLKQSEDFKWSNTYVGSDIISTNLYVTMPFYEIF